jgi:hypothetical protein
MATRIKIGHASISEHGTSTGTAGDSGDREVYIKSDYDITNLNPTVVLRPKLATLAEASAVACEAGCNNAHIGYSQSSRNTLYSLASAVNFDLAQVNTDCNTDCSAFMTVCAIAGGAKISYGSNAPTTTNMRTRFKQSGDYSVLTDTKHLTVTDYLKRGDILVKEGKHTVMVLENGSNYEDEITDLGGDIITAVTKVSIYNISLDVSTLAPTKAAIIMKAFVQKTGSSAIIFNTTQTNNYKWTYQLSNLTTNTSSASKRFTVNSGQGTISLASLSQSTVYSLVVTATKLDGSTSFCSQKLLFSTPAAKPDSIKNLSVIVTPSMDLDKECLMTFDGPEYWGNAVSSKGFRVSIVTNGKIIAFKDNLIKAASTKVTKTIRLSDIINIESLSLGETIQLGVQAWSITSENDILFDDETPKCSDIIYLNGKYNVINKLFIKMRDKFNRAIIYRK